jgi:DNA-binding response OmpR family regulator
MTSAWNRYGPRVLVIDDDPVFGHMLAGKAALRAMDVQYYPSLIEAVYATDLRAFDVFVIDRFMPEMDGVELAEYFRTFHEAVPVVVVSRAKGDGDAWWRHTGIRAYVAKRQGLDAILDTVQKVA